MSGPVANLVDRLDAKRSGNGWLAKCPAHDDHKPSLSINEGVDGRALVKCHAGCTTDAILSALGLTNRDLFPITTHQRPNGTTASTAFDWQMCLDTFTDRHVEQVARWRGFSTEFVRELRDNGWIGIYSGVIAFPVHDNAGNIVAAHYRLKDGSWRYYPQGTKVRPLVIGELIAGEPIQVSESQWDGFAFMHISGERSGIIITRGASNAALVADLIPERSTVYVWTQNDAAGEKWQKDICAHAKATVKRPKIPAPHKDLNDWTRAGATASDFLAAINGAELIKESDKSWDDALTAAIVTSSELRELVLVSRRKLLGDWFCEGDLGFIFAFRGVGKTWLGLAIAQALSTGGGLGQWPAHAPVNVLYIDGEMPPDLMRDRCEGLKSSNANLEFLNHEILFERTGKVLNIANPDIQQAITARCVNTGVKVLILDNLSTLASGMRENEADSWELVNNWLLDLRRRKIAVVIIHHAGRSGEMRGTSKREDNVFWIIALDDAKKQADDKRGARFISRFTKASRNTQEDIPAYEWHIMTETDGQVFVSYKLAQSMDVLLQHIRDGITHCGDLAKEMRVSEGQISKLAKKAIDQGKLMKNGREYVSVEDGNEEL